MSGDGKEAGMNTNDVVLSYSFEKTTSRGMVTDKLLKNMPPMYLIVVLKVEKEVLKYGSRAVFKLAAFILELRRN